jgi:hypothetical protein
MAAALKCRREKDQQRNEIVFIVNAETVQRVQKAELRDTSESRDHALLEIP